MGSEGDDVVVSRFRSLVKRHWHQPLNKHTCIPREDRKAVRDVIRLYVERAPPIEGPNVAGRPLNLYFKKYVEKNPVFVAIFGDPWIKDALTFYRQFSDISTLGRLYLFVVHRIMTGKTHRDNGVMNVADVSETSARETIDTRASAFCENFMWYMGSVCAFKENKNLFFGVPMFWWYGVDAKKIYDTLNKLFMHAQTGYDYTVYSLAFMRLMAEVNGTDVRHMPHVKVVFNKLHRFRFVMSVPELVMDGLCFTAWDEFTKTGKAFSVDIFVSPLRHNSGAYWSVDHDKEGALDPLPRPDTVDCSAVRISYYPDPRHHVRSAKSWDDKQEVHDRTYYYDYGDLWDVSRNEYERRDRLTFSNECGVHRVWRDEDPDRSTYWRMLHDRFMGEINVTPFPPPPPSPAAPQCVLPEHVDRLLRPMEETLAAVKACCEKNRAAGRHLESHIETMRQYAVVVSNKTDVHTCRPPGSAVTRHALDGSLPPPHVLGVWRPRSECGRRRAPLVSQARPWWWGRHGAIW
ncbi:A type inclusion protein [Equine parapoxvirus]|nr:A type inclusion protein [Equine parapoxvirus]WOC35511.1 A type inclusion protein [Equine parapoxvirus]